VLVAVLVAVLVVC